MTTVVDDDNTEQLEQNANDLEEKLEPENDTIAEDTPKEEEEEVATDEVQENPEVEAAPPAEE